MMIICYIHGFFFKMKMSVTARTGAQVTGSVKILMEDIHVNVQRAIS